MDVNTSVDLTLYCCGISSAKTAYIYIFLYLYVPCELEVRWLGQLPLLLSVWVSLPRAGGPVVGGRLGSLPGGRGLYNIVFRYVL